jgi:hypothetical protein
MAELHMTVAVGGPPVAGSGRRLRSRLGGATGLVVLDPMADLIGDIDDEAGDIDSVLYGG